MTSLKMKEDRVVKIHDFAECTSCWNEQLWFTLMQSRRERFQAALNRKRGLSPRDLPQVYYLLTVDLCYLPISPIFFFWRTRHVSTVVP
jgi:hypothetical protein